MSAPDDGAQGHENVVRIAFAAAGNNQVASRFQATGRSSQKGGMIIHPMERGVGENDVKRLREMQSARILTDEAQIRMRFLGECRPGVTDHFRRIVHPG